MMTSILNLKKQILLLFSLINVFIILLVVVVLVLHIRDLKTRHYPFPVILSLFA